MTRIAAGDTKSSSLDLTPYLAYPWIKVYCDVFDGSTKIGVLNWTNYKSNDEDELPNFILQYSGDDVFHYDANGDIYDVTEYDDIEHVLRCNIATSQADSLTFTMRWLDSDKKPITIEQEFKDSMMRSVWVDAGDNSLHFKVRTKFYEMLNNNTVYVRLTALDGTYVDYEKEISFLKDGDQGTNGTTYLCLIRPINLNSEVKRTDKVALRYADGAWGTDQIAFKAFVYCNGELIEQRTDKADFNVSYTWQSRNVEIVTAGQNIYHKVNIKPMENGGTDRYFNGGHHTRPGDTALTPEEMGGFYIKVQVDIRYKTESKISVYAYYPIDVCVGVLDLAKVSYAAPQYIKYSSSGVNPQYDSEPLAFSYDGVDGKVESLSGFLGIWNNYLTPASHYTGENNSVGLLKMSMENNEVDYLLHSIFMYLNPYGNEAINSWDGTTIEINDDGGTILAPQIGAGKKNTFNQFSGVVMGKDSVQKQTGLYGYKEGINTFALMEDGKATFGGKQQITIDGDNAQITGKNGVTNNQRFLEINLADPNIKDENGNDTEKAADAIKIGSSISDPNFLVDYDGNLTANAGTIGGWKIGKTSLSNGSGETKVELNSSGAKAINIGNGAFSVTPGGYLIATKGYIDNLTIGDAKNALTFANGNIYLNGGQILGQQTGDTGNWKMTATTLSNGSTTIDNDGDIMLTHSNRNRVIFGNVCSISGQKVDNNTSGSLYLNADAIYWHNGKDTIALTGAGVGGVAVLGE